MKNIIKYCKIFPSGFKPLKLQSLSLLQIPRSPWTGDLLALLGDPWGEAVGVLGRELAMDTGFDPEGVPAPDERPRRAGSKNTPAELWMRVCKERTSSKSDSL